MLIKGLSFAALEAKKRNRDLQVHFKVFKNVLFHTFLVLTEILFSQKLYQKFLANILKSSWKFKICLETFQIVPLGLFIENNSKKCVRQTFQICSTIFWSGPEHSKKCWFLYISNLFKNIISYIFKMFLNRTIEKCSWTFQKIPEQVCTHFKVSKWKMFENNSQCSG